MSTALKLGIPALQDTFSKLSTKLSIHGCLRSVLVTVKQKCPLNSVIKSYYFKEL